MRRLAAVIFLITFLLSGCALGSSQKKDTTEKPNIINMADKSVVLMIPVSYEKLRSQEDCDAYAKEKGYSRIVLNSENQMLSFYLTPEQHEKILRETQEEIDRNISVISNSSSYMDVVDISHNDTLTEFTIVLNTQKPSDDDRKLIDFLFTYGQRYNVYAGVTNKKINVIMKDESGRLLEERNSAE